MPGRVVSGFGSAGFRPTRVTSSTTPGSLILGIEMESSTCRARLPYMAVSHAVGSSLALSKAFRKRKMKETNTIPSILSTVPLSTTILGRPSLCLPRFEPRCKHWRGNTPAFRAGDRSRCSHLGPSLVFFRKLQICGFAWYRSFHSTRRYQASTSSNGS